MKNRVDIVSSPLVKACYPNNLSPGGDMIELRPLIIALAATFDWHGARITFVAQFLAALLRVRTVNCAEIATAFCGESTLRSHYRRIQRFFQAYTLHRAQVVAAVLRWLPLTPKWLLCLDRTNWKFGAMDINILVLAGRLSRRGHSPSSGRSSINAGIPIPANGFGLCAGSCGSLGGSAATA